MITKEKLKPFTGAILVFTGAFFFSGKAVLVKLGISAGASILTLLNLRMLFSLPFFVAIAYFSGKNSQNDLSIKDWGSVIFLGVIGYYLASYFDFEGLKYISAGLERLIVFMYPTLVVVLSALFFKTKVGRKELTALILTYSGIFIAFSVEPGMMNKNTFWGAGLVFCSALTYAIYLIGSGRLIPKIGSMRFMSYAMIVSTFAVLLHSYSVNDLNLEASAKVMIIGLLMAVLCTVVPAILLAEGIKRIGSGPASIIGSVGPVSTIILAAMLLDEEITLVQVTGTLLVIVGVLLAGKKDSKQLEKAQ